AAKAAYPILLAEINNNPELKLKLVEVLAQQTKHRIDTEKQLIALGVEQQKRAQIYTFTVSTLSLICATCLGYWGSPWLAGIIAIVGVGGPSAALAVAERMAKPRSGP
ncbi:MAG: hypothetical protein KGZ83_00360, partial [Sulfuricella sp.]|nr:hypothetical protein [Sulfuricella sp.]